MSARTHLPHAFGRYILRERIAAGGMAEVFRAGLPGFGGFEREVAIKRMFRHLSDDPGFVAMLADEARISSQLHHPNIVSILDFGQEGQDWFLCYELVDGVDLFRMLQRQFELGRDLPVALAILVVAELASALDFAHARRGQSGEPMHIVHRDVSPQNVLVGFQGDVKLTDFGIAKAAARATQTAAGQVKGKIYYMSPEQARGEALDHRSDLFSAGILLFELLCTKPLYEEGDHGRLLDLVGRAEVRWPAEKVGRIPPALRTLADRALARSPDVRFQSGREMREALRRVADELHLRGDREQLGAWTRRLFGVADDRPPMPIPSGPRNRDAHWASQIAPVPTEPPEPVPAPAPTHPQRPSRRVAKVALPRSVRSSPEIPRPIAAPQSRPSSAALQSAAAGFDDDAEATSMLDADEIARRLGLAPEPGPTASDPPPLPTVAAAQPMPTLPAAARTTAPRVPAALQPAAKSDAPPPLPGSNAPPAAKAAPLQPPVVPAAAAPQPRASQRLSPAVAPPPAPRVPARSRLSREIPAAARPAVAAPSPAVAVAAPAPPASATLAAAAADAVAPGASTAPAAASGPAPASEASTRFVQAMPDDEAPRPRPVPQRSVRVTPVFRAAGEEPASWGLLALTAGVWSGVLVLGVYAILLLVR